MENIIDNFVNQQSCANKEAITYLYAQISNKVIIFSSISLIYLLSELNSVF